MKIARETKDVPHDLIGDDVPEQASHICERTWVFDQFGEDVMLKADGECLDPSKSFGLCENLGGDLADQGIGIGDGLGCRSCVVCVDPFRLGGGGLQRF